MGKAVIYLRELSSGLDSGMTLQVLNDYGHLSAQGHQVVVPALAKRDEQRLAMEAYCKRHSFSDLSLIWPRLRPKRIRSVLMLFLALALVFRMKDSGVILVIRQRKYFLVARILRFFLSTPIVSELHEGGLPLKVSRSRKKSFQNLFRKVDGVVFTNASQIEYLKNLKYELPSNYVVLPNGVEVEKFAKASVGDGDAREVFMTYTGQFTSWKNVPLVFEILKYLPSHFKLRIAGGKVDGSNSESYIHGLEEEFDVKGRVDYVGFVHPDRIVDDALSGSSVLLVPLGEADVARYATSPMKLVEYMATPIPIVAVGHPSVLSLAGEDTVHLTTTDVDDFADAVLRAINEDVALRRERIRRANQRSAKYDHKNRAALYSSWLEDF